MFLTLNINQFYACSFHSCLKLAAYHYFVAIVIQCLVAFVWSFAISFQDIRRFLKCLHAITADNLFTLQVACLGNILTDKTTRTPRNIGRYMGELSRLSELTRFAELTRPLLLFPIISTLRLHGKRVVPLRRDPGWRFPSYSLRRDRNSHVIAFAKLSRQSGLKNQERAL